VDQHAAQRDQRLACTTLRYDCHFGYKVASANSIRWPQCRRYGFVFSKSIPESFALLSHNVATSTKMNR
jgi:hypothetical protein